MSLANSAMPNSLLFVLFLMAINAPGCVAFTTGETCRPSSRERSPCTVLPSQTRRRHGILLSGPRRPNMLRLYSSATPSPPFKQISNARGPVLYQKILKSTGPDDLEFLGSLVAWLQDGWDLTSQNLPMVYEKRIYEDFNDTNDAPMAVLTWNSPLSPHPPATALHVDVVAVYPQSANSQQGKVMAMVVLSKQAESTQEFDKLAPMLQNLFLDSERRVVQHLDHALMDWAAASGTTEARQTSTVSSASKLKQAKRDMLEELLEMTEASTNSKDTNGEAVMDAEIVTDPVSSQSAPSNGVEQASTVNPDDTSSTDFTVEAARRVVRQQQGEDFAVRAARQVAQRQRKPQPSATTETERPSTSKLTDSPSPSTNLPKEAIEESNPKTIDPRQFPPPSLSEEVLASRVFAQTISRPQDFVKRDAKQRKNSPQVDQSRSTYVIDAGKADVSGGTNNNVPDPTQTPETPTGDNPPAKAASKFRKLNIASKQESYNSQEEEEEQVRLANEALDEIVESTEDIDAREMLQAVIQFGEEKRKEEATGEGFVSGAFEKAKELLKEQHQKREERLRQRVTTQVVQDFPDVRPDISLEQEEAPLSPEEELRRMFEAGEKIADSRITLFGPNSKGEIYPSTEQDEKVIDELVSSNKEVSTYARVLDDELVELEMRINKSPDETTYGTGQNPLFDIFSGPEVYNPNVDPSTAVNWPGAPPDSKTGIRLPRELDEAVKQAKFAASVLSRVEEKKENDVTKFFVGDRELSADQLKKMRTVVDEASNLGLIVDPLTIVAERSRLQMIIDELWDQPADRFRDIVSEYKDLLLSDHFVGLVKERLREMADRDIDALRRDDTTTLERRHEREREILGGLVAYAQLLLKEARALGAELEAQQLEVIRCICKVAMDPSHKTEEETAIALTDTVRDMRPMFDDAFVAYLKYAVAEEESRLARAGVLDDPDHTQWLYVLKIVQQGVYNEISRGIGRYIDHISYILRMETPKERRMLLSEIIDALPTLDVRPFVQTVNNIAGALGDSARGEFDGSIPLGEQTNKILQLHRDVEELLPPERIARMSRDADDWARRKKEKLLEQRKLSKQRLAAARDTEHLDSEIDAMSRQGETERFD